MNNFTKNTFTKLAITMSLVLYFCYNPVESRPSESFNESSDFSAESVVDPSLYNGNLSVDVIRQIQKCDRNIEDMELCMRCAKVTKSEIVYPKCCDNEEDIKDWCRSYIYYGINPNSS